MAAPRSNQSPSMRFGRREARMSVQLALSDSTAIVNAVRISHKRDNSFIFIFNRNSIEFYCFSLSALLQFVITITKYPRNNWYVGTRYKHVPLVQEKKKKCCCECARVKWNFFSEICGVRIWFQILRFALIFFFLFLHT